LTGWKKVVSRNNPNEEVVRDGKFTVAGFLAIFDVFISQNRLDVPWQALRKFGYDDNLTLHIPEKVLQVGEEESWSLSISARRFLSDLFHQFDSDHEGVLSLDDIERLFSIVPNPSLPPWHPLRSQGLFRGCFSLPRMPSSPSSPRLDSSGEEGASPLSMSQSFSASGITIVSGETFPSVDISTASLGGMYTNAVSSPLSFLDWMGMWHAISSISPSTTRAELFRLGHTEDTKKSKRRIGKKKSLVSPSKGTADSLLPSREVRVLLLGSPGSGKTALLNALCCTKDAVTTTKTRSPETFSTYVRLKRRKKPKSSKAAEDESFVAHLVITEVPEAEAEQQAQRKKELSEILNGGECDLVILAFDSTNSASLAYAKHLESTLLTEEMSRVYVGTKSDQCGPTEEKVEDDDEWQPATVIDEAGIHCRELDLEPPLVTSASENMLSAEGELGEMNRNKTLDHLARCCLYEAGVESLRAKPHEERKRREAEKRRNRKMMWFGVGVGVAVVVVGYLWTGATGNKGDDRRDRLGWFRSLFSRRIATKPKAE
jgi:Ras family protein T1